jgi:drug/metabolite transporter (DMT)-like permease
VLSKIYTDAPEIMKIGATEYSILCAIVALVMSVTILLFMKKENSKLNKKSIFAIIGSGIFSKIPNYLLLISLLHLPASAQYPFITGGTMIVSTVIAYITRQKPSKKEVLSVAFSFVGLMALVLIP